MSAAASAMGSAGPTPKRRPAKRRAVTTAPPNPNQAPGLTHIGLYSDNANTTVAQLKQAGAMVTDARPSANSGSILANVTDPNGIRLEINEQPAGSLMRKAMEGWR